MPPDTGDDEMLHSTIVDADDPMSSSCSGSSGSDNMSIGCTEVVRKKRSSVFYVCARSAGKVSDEDMATSMSRRKGIPHRSPMC